MLIKRGLIPASMILLLFVGCSGAPSGFPKVLPCSVTVLDGTTPIADVEVTLQSETAQKGLVFFGKTDASGVCKVGTTFQNYYKKGVPEGSYKVILIKEPYVEDTIPREEQLEMSRGALDAYRKSMQAKRDALPRIIPVSMTSASTTPLEMSVNGKNSQLEVNVSASN